MFHPRHASSLLLLLAACATAPAGGPSANPSPDPLTGAARALVLRHIAAFDGADGPSPLHGSPGNVAAMTGESVQYDRYLLVGSALQAERARDFGRFVDELRALGGSYYVVQHSQDGQPTKVLVVVDGQRVMVSRLEW